MAMDIAEFERWREEVLFTGRIVQDSDTSVDPDEAGRRARRYTELVESSRGNWTEEVFQTLIESLQVDDDYEVYETTVGVIFSFPPEKFGGWLVKALPGLVRRQPARAGDFLSLMVNNYRGSAPQHLVAFRDALRRAPATLRDELLAFIAQQEREGWLQEKAGFYVA
jgi:hypothetical protein